MPSTIVPSEGVKLIHDNHPKIPEEYPLIHATGYQHDLQGLRGRQQNARVRVSREPDRQRLDAIKELMTERWHDQASTAEGYALFDSGAHCDDNAYAAVFDTMYPAFAEISLRVLYGQQIDNDTLDDLLTALLQKLAPV